MLDEFPFVAELPKRDQVRVKSVWDHVKDFAALIEGKGVPLPPVTAAELLGVSPQRIHQMVEAGQLEVVELRGKKFITEHSVLDLAKVARTCGTRYNTSPGFALLERSDSRLQNTSK
jgi:hypothetical protein